MGNGHITVCLPCLVIPACTHLLRRHSGQVKLILPVSGCAVATQFPVQSGELGKFFPTVLLKKTCSKQECIPVGSWMRTVASVAVSPVCMPPVTHTPCHAHPLPCMHPHHVHPLPCTPLPPTAMHALYLPCTAPFTMHAPSTSPRMPPPPREQKE